MCKNEIIEQLYKSPQFNDCISKMRPEHLQDDLKAEVILTLLEQPNKKIQQLHTNGHLMFFTSRIVTNMIQSNRSKFCKMYRSVTTNVIPELQYEEMNGRIKKEMQEELALQLVDQMYWYDKEIVKLYLRLGNFRLIEKETGIPWESCYKTVCRVTDRVKEQLGLKPPETINISIAV